MTQIAARAARDRGARRPKDKAGVGIALLFPGQGAQRAGMGKAVVETSEAARRVFDESDETLGFPLSQLCFDGSAEELGDTINAQPAIVATSLAHLAHLRERFHQMGRRLRPSFLAGHSLGQFTAAIAANSIDVGEGLRLVMERGRVMAEAARARPGGMASVLGLSDRKVREVCKEASPEGKVKVAVVNGEDQTVISGDENALQDAMQLARQRGGRVLRLAVSVPGHTPLMRDAARELSRLIERLPFRDPETPLVSSLTARVLTQGDEVRQELSDQMCAAVQWARCVVAMANQGAGVFLEVGPGHALARMVSRIRDDAKSLSVEDASTQELLAVAGRSMTSVRAGARNA
jgi:[acyl-carrier-protein] S-malonyltransferase